MVSLSEGFIGATVDPSTVWKVAYSFDQKMFCVESTEFRVSVVSMAAPRVDCAYSNVDWFDRLITLW